MFGSESLDQNGKTSVPLARLGSECTAPRGSVNYAREIFFYGLGNNARRAWSALAHGVAGLLRVGGRLSHQFGTAGTQMSGSKSERVGPLATWRTRPVRRGSRGGASGGAGPFIPAGYREANAIAQA